jgi:hypothetical protein
MAQLCHVPPCDTWAPNRAYGSCSLDCGRWVGRDDRGRGNPIEESPSSIGQTAR